MDVGEGFIKKFEEHFGRIALKMLLGCVFLGVTSISLNEFYHYFVFPIYELVSTVNFSQITNVKSKVIADIIVTLSASAVSATLLLLFGLISAMMSLQVFKLVIERRRTSAMIKERTKNLLKRLDNLQGTHGQLFREIRPKIDQIFDTTIVLEKDNVAKANEIVRLNEEIYRLKNDDGTKN
ncbi:hypothetical protein [Acidocella sp.]|uniref:hypothetical protein n=1 Tax=Acidocella sp. TaxID=50710 RepID=UPI0017B8B928|nr:hypothetical protein [Acidocella sp.]NNM55752.1 hypothetical protein [Acidocella sp.]